MTSPRIRMTRSKSKQAADQNLRGVNNAPPNILLQQPPGDRISSGTNQGIVALPEVLDCQKTGLTQKEVRLLNRKRTKLEAEIGYISEDINQITTRRPNQAPSLIQSAAATLVFAQEEAGTAVCISSSGLLLTCSHCVAETAADSDRNRPKWLLFASGQVVRARCVAYDGKRDLALLQITDATATPGASGSLHWPFPSAVICDKDPGNFSSLICVGHPGSEDLEASRPGVKTGYDILHVSNGRYRGLASEQDVHDNSEIGALKHDCWTYWGHSGAPLFERETGMLVGLHSSWDDETGMRRGIHLTAMRAFLREHAGQVDGIPL